MTLALPGPAKTSDTPAQRWSARRQVTLGVIALVILLGGFGTWAATANISGAIIASGRVAVEDNRQVVQHPDGGVVAALDVREGDRVEAGQALIRLDDRLLRGEARIVGDQLAEVSARAARLSAERDGATAIDFDPALLAAAREDEAVAGIVAGQRTLFDARRVSTETQIAQLERRKDQIATQVEGTRAQGDALGEQLGFIEEELEASQSLLDRGLAQAPRVLALRREQAALLGTVGELAATAAGLEGRATEIDIEIEALRARTREAAISELRDLRAREAELRERAATLAERLDRLEIASPVTGIVYDLQVFGERAVIRPAEPVLYVVPQDRPLVIQTEVEPIHIDQVFPGQPVVLRLPAFDARTTPELQGRVLRVSPDAFVDQATGRAFYAAAVTPDPGETDKLQGQPLLPGMPVEAYLRTEDRTPIAYLVKPLSDYFTRAFREQ